nr:unnamed protein product [Callosobruchus chinensis]
MVFQKITFFALILIIAFSQAIIDPYHQQTKYYTPGIKTKNWKNEHVITHQNYSKVFFHNNSSGTVYNGHHYGFPNDNSTKNPEETSREGKAQDILQISSEEHIRPVIHKRKISKALEVYEKCPPGANGQFVYHLSCNQFLNCWKGRGNVQNCAPGTLFNPKTLECDYPEKVECVTGPRQNTVSRIRSAKSIAQPKCPEDFTGLIPNYTDCSKFINCNNGQFMSQDCPPGTLFDTNRNLCDFPQNAVCFNGQNEVLQSGNEYMCSPSTPQNCANGGTTSTSHTKCDPSTKNCYLVFPNSQYSYLISGNLQKTGHGSSATGRQFVHTGSSYTDQQPHSTSCDLSSQNCGSNVFGSDNSKARGQSETYSYTYTACNPQTQNCAQATSCDPQSQNCGQVPSYSQTNKNCDPNNPNCSSKLHGQAVLLTGEVACNPRKQKCEDYGQPGHNGANTNNQNTHGSSAYGGGQTTTYTHGTGTNQKACDPNTRNCGPYNTQTMHRHHSTTNIGTGDGHRNCDPRIENCGQPGQGNGQTTHHVNLGHYPGNGQQACDPQTQNCGQYSQHGQTGVTAPHGQIRCDPRTQNCDQPVQSGQATYPGQWIYGQAATPEQYGQGRCDPLTQNCGQQVQNGYTFGTGQQACDPQTQNCNQYYHDGHVKTPKQDGQSRCDHATQNCGQQVQHGLISGTGQACDPRTQNCNQYYQHGHVRTPESGGQSRCDPTIQNCGQQVQHGLISETGQACDPRTQNCNQYHQHGHVRAPESGGQSRCDPTIQNCGQQVQHGLISGTGQQACDPRTQNCNQYYQHGHVRTPESGGQSRCDPATQNCGQQIHYGQASSTGQWTCDPRTQNCRQYYQEGQYGSPKQNGQSYSGQGSQVTCDPFTQNCGQYHEHGQSRCDPSKQNCEQGNFQTIHSSNIGQNVQKNCDPQKQNCEPNLQPCNPLYHNCPPTIRPVQNSLEGRCNPHEENCSPSSHREPKILNHNSKSTECIAGQNCDNAANYKKICNINDHKCRSGSHNIVSKDTSNEKLKCPDGYQGITKHPTDCRKFLNCANGQTFVQDCAPGTLFNPKLGNCDFAYNVDCDEAKAEPPVEEQTEDYDGYTESYGAVPSSTWYGQYEDRSQYPQGGSSGSTEQTTWQKQYEDHARQYGSNPGHGNIRAPLGSSGQREHRVKPIAETNRGKSGILIRPVTPHALPVEDQSESISSFSDYVDVFDPKEQRYVSVHSTTPRAVSRWPIPIPTTDPDADYIFEYDDGEPITLKPDNIIYAEYKKKKVCGKGDFYCSSKMCITKAMVCDGHRDCESGRDEKGCEEFIGRFTASKNAQLEVLEKQRWINVSYTTCAMLCIQSNTFNCRSFNYRKYDRTCFLSDLNVGLTGALRVYNPVDYYELSTGTIDCSDQSKYFECSNKKCLIREQLCDGTDDCGDRQDEKNCSPKDFGYSIKLAGAKEKNQGRIEVTAFGKTGYICDDQFGLQEANIVCKELGFELGAIDVKGQSYFAKDVKENNTLYMMDDLKCFGNENSLLDCNFAGWGIHDCQDLEIVGVVCKTPEEKCGKGFWKCATTSECVPLKFMCDDLNDCSDDSDEDSQYCEAPPEIRLVNGSSSHEGRLEVSHYGIWGTICDDDFNEDAAKFVCKRLGYKGASTVKKDSYFGAGTGPIWLDQVSCAGEELDLKDCTTWDWGEHNCDHNEDVGVICDDTVAEVEVQRHAILPQDGEAVGLAKMCGLRKDNQFMENDLIQARVVKGGAARKGDYPWQAAIRAKYRDKTAHWCGAVILGRKWVLTAAHCLQGYPKGSYIIAAGDYNIDEEEGTEQLRYIEEYFIHEQYRKGGHKMNNDIALVKLKGGGFEFTDDVQAICLPDTDVDYESDLNCTISGYGSVKSGVAAYSHKMMAAWIPILSKKVCNMPHIYDSALTDGMICAGSLDGGVDSCDGDSGGPLACLDQGFFTLYGITSWGHRCGFANKPGVYVKVANYRQWIENTIEKNS